MTRVRCLTPSGAAGLAVIAVEGEDVSERLARVGLEPPAVGHMALVRPRVRGEILDEALVWTPAPGRVELGLHGSPPLVTEVLEALGGDLRPSTTTNLEQRARELLASAPAELAARILLDQVEGALRREMEAFARGALEAHELADRYHRARRFLEPARVVLAGPVNAGKSTLFNLLVGALIFGQPLPQFILDTMCERFVSLEIPVCFEPQRIRSRYVRACFKQQVYHLIRSIFRCIH